MPCNGNGSDHCCWVKGEPCSELIYDYVDETGHFRKYACAIRRDLGNWDDVIASDRYKAATGHAWVNGLNCRDWPDGDGPNKGYCDDPSCRVLP